MSDKVISKGRMKMKGKSGGKFTEAFRSKSTITGVNSTSVQKQKVKRNGKAVSKHKEVTKEKDGKTYISRGKDGGNFTKKEISNKRYERVKKRWSK